MVLARNFPPFLTWPSLFSQPHSYPGKCWCSQYPQCWPGHHAPDFDCCGPANRRHQPAGGCGLAAVSTCRWVSCGTLNIDFPESQGYKVAAKIVAMPIANFPTSLLLSFPPTTTECLWEIQEVKYGVFGSLTT